MPIDLAKKTAILESISGEGDAIPASVFFDGNDDDGSFAVNAADGDWLGKAKRVFGEIAARKGVSGVWFVIVDTMDTEDDFWVYSDTVLVRTSATYEEVEEWSLDLAPDEMWPVDDDELPEAVEPRDGETVYCLWWD